MKVIFNKGKYRAARAAKKYWESLPSYVYLSKHIGGPKKSCLCGYFSILFNKSVFKKRRRKNEAPIGAINQSMFICRQQPNGFSKRQRLLDRATVL